MNAERYAAFFGGPPRVRDRVAWAVPIAILFGLVVYTALIYRTLPAEIPSHVDFSGNVNGWSGRGFVWFFPAIGVATDVMMIIVGQFPQSWNTGVKLTVFNAAAVYRLVRDMLTELRIALALIWAVSEVWILHLESWGHGEILAVLLIALTAIPVLRYVLRVSALKRRGMR